MSALRDAPEAFRVRLANLLVPMGFEVRAQHENFVRKRGKNLHRVAFRPRRDWEGLALEGPSLLFEDAATRKLVKGWQAGGSLGHEDFCGEHLQGMEPAALAALVVEKLSFFDWMEDPGAVLRDVSTRYVPGLIDPVRIAAFLQARSGTQAVLTYARALLDGRPELAPAFMTEQATPGELPFAQQLDHGTQLARSVHAYADGQALAVPADTVRSTLTTARHLRCFFGRQLRAWGEPEVARQLHRVEDAAIQAAYERQETMGPKVMSVQAARLLIEVVTGTARAPRNTKPEPLFFQYHAQMVEPFGGAR